MLFRTAALRSGTSFARVYPVAPVNKASYSTYIERKQSQLRNSRIAAAVGVFTFAFACYAVKRGMSHTQAVRKANPTAKKEVDCALDPKQFVPYPLKEVHDINHNTKRFTFELPLIDRPLGLPVASCIITRIKKPSGDGYIIRPYTPTSTNEDIGEFDLVVKHYPGGPMSEHIFGMKKGDMLEVKGPIVKLKYEPNKYEKIGMVAGGTGLTPMLQVIQEIMSNPDDKTKVSFIFANREERDILLKDELDKLAKANPDRLKIHYTLDHPSKNWKGEKGYLTKEMIQKYLPSKDERAIILVCGPSQMLEHVSGNKTPDYQQGEVGGILAQLGYTKDKVFKF